MKDLFLITGGGTGAKVAEALTHLCAAGIGPERLHILLVDADTSNGNLRRTQNTLAAYERMQRWHWQVKTTIKTSKLKIWDSGEQVGLHLFRTRIDSYLIAEQIGTVFGGGLSTVAPDGMGDVLDLLYDRNEQEDTHEQGFKARPNLGCLLMADHLGGSLNRQGEGFMKALAHAAGSTSSKTPVVVAASVFGGTGASLLPVARRAVEQALEERGSPNLVSKLRWGATKLLPYYRPNQRKGSVDPDRYLLDAFSALQYYSTVYQQNGSDGSHAQAANSSGTYDVAYVVGSNNLARNTVKTHTGESGQANPGYLEEAIAALGVLDFAAHPGGQPVRLFTQARTAWETLPAADRDHLKVNLGYLLHLAAFYHRRGSNASTSQGLGRLLREEAPAALLEWPWYKNELHAWAKKNSEPYRSASVPAAVDVLRSEAQTGSMSVEYMLRPAADYFGRLLLWAESALVESSDSGLVRMDDSAADYADVYNGMSDVSTSDIEFNMKGGSEEDNALIRVLRTALAGMVRAHELRQRGKPIGATFKLLEGTTVPLRISMQQADESLAHLGLNGLPDEYRRTRIRQVSSFAA